MAYRQKHPYIVQIFLILKHAAKDRLGKLLRRVRK